MTTAKRRPQFWFGVAGLLAIFAVVLWFTHFPPRNEIVASKIPRHRDLLYPTLAVLAAMLSGASILAGFLRWLLQD